MDQLKKNREFIIKYYNRLSGEAKTPELCAKYTTDKKLLEHIAFFEGAFPKYELFIEEMMTEGNKVIVQARAIGIHKGALNGIPPTGRKMDLPFCIRYTIENEIITDHWLIADQIVLMEQLGVMVGESESSAH